MVFLFFLWKLFRIRFHSKTGSLIFLIVVASVIFLLATCALFPIMIRNLVNRSDMDKYTKNKYTSLNAESFEKNIELLIDKSSNPELVTKYLKFFNDKNIKLNTKYCTDCMKDMFLAMANTQKPTVYFERLNSTNNLSLLLNISKFFNSQLSMSYIQSMSVQAYAADMFHYKPFKEVELIRYLYELEQTEEEKKEVLEYKERNKFKINNLSIVNLLIYFPFFFLAVIVLFLFDSKIIVTLKEGFYLDFLYRCGLPSAVFWACVWVFGIIQSFVVSLFVTIVFWLLNTDVTEKTTFENWVLIYTVLFFSCCYIAALFYLFTTLIRKYIFVVVIGIGFMLIQMTMIFVNYFMFLENTKYYWMRNMSLVFPVFHIPKLVFEALNNKSILSGYMLAVLLFTIIMPFILILLTIYLDNVAPNGNGLRLPKFYFLNSKYWRRGELFDPAKTRESDKNIEEFDGKCNEKVKHNLNATLVLDNVGKTYKPCGIGCLPAKPVVAVKDFSCSIYKNQITCFIGHNGAGKTTLISMLIGKEEATSGSAYIGNVQVTDPYDRLKLNGKLGICEQTNVICGRLSVRDNVHMVLSAKGKLDDKNRESAEEMFVELGIDGKKLAGTLSGGQKRKLCTIMALVGDPSVVYLDEPTSGLDPVSRRQMWKLLQRHKEGKVLILSTHFMDEADLLADRKLFIKNGEKICSGSSLFLRSLFKCGFLIDITTKATASSEQVISSLKEVCAELEIRGTVNSSEFQVFVPLKHRQKLAELVRQLEIPSSQGGLSEMINHFGLSPTTLDDIFTRTKDRTSKQILKVLNRDESTEMKLGFRISVVLKNPINNVGGVFESLKEVCPEVKLCKKMGPTEFSVFVCFEHKEKLSLIESSLKNKISDNLINLVYSQETLDGIFRVKKVLSYEAVCTLLKRPLTETDSVPVQNVDTKVLNEVKYSTNFRMQFAAQLDMNTRRLRRQKCKLCCRFVFPAILLLALFGLTFVDKYIVFLNERAIAYPSHIYYPPLYDSEPVEAIKFCVGDDNDTTFNRITSLPFCQHKEYKPSNLTLREFLINNCNSILKKISIKNTDEFERSFYIDKMTPTAFVYLNNWDNSSTNTTSASFGYLIDSEFSVYNTNDQFQFIFNFLARFANLPKLKVVMEKTQLPKFVEITYVNAGLFALIILLAIIPVTYLSDPIEDKEMKVRSQLTVMGMTSLSYWLNTLLLHWVQYCLFLILAGIVLVSVFPALYTNAVFIAFVLLPVAFIGIPSTLLFFYTIGSLFKKPRICVTVLLFFLQFLISVNIIQIIQDSFAQILMSFVYPPYAPLQLIYAASRYQNVANLYGLSAPQLSRYFWSHLYCYLPFVAMICHLCLCTILLYILDNRTAVLFKLNNVLKFFKFKKDQKRSNSIRSRKPDVADGVENGHGDGSLIPLTKVNKDNRTDIFSVSDLCKTYPNGTKAVKGISFSTKPGQIFALLGENGAGKSTTMAVLVGEEACSSGDCIIFDKDTNIELCPSDAASKGLIGFCPQHNPLFPNVTVKEHLYFYARVRGVPTNEAKKQVPELMKSLALEPHRNKFTSDISGGNKRRLCLAIALLGNPLAVIIDEASTGVDPETKHAIWEAIKQISTDKRSVIITTHSMEEVEALANDVAIMYQGTMLEQGTVQSLKSKYGNKYTLEILFDETRLDTTDGVSNVNQMTIERIKKQKQFEHSEVLNNYMSRVVLEIPKPRVDNPHFLSESLNWLSANSEQLAIQYFSLYQVSMDQVFVNLMELKSSQDHCQNSQENGSANVRNGGFGVPVTSNNNAACSRSNENNV